MAPAALGKRLPLLLAALLLLLACGAAPAAALYEDQAGTFDWHRQHIGEVLYAAHGGGRDRFYVATAQGIAAAVSAADGAVAWRRTHPEEDPLAAAVALAKPSLLVVASRGGRHLRAWGAADGALRWEAAAAPRDAPPNGAAALAAVALREGAAVAAAAGGGVQVRAGGSGALIWEARLGGAGDGVKLVAPSGGSIFAASYAPGSNAVSVGAFGAEDGAESASAQLEAAAPLGAAAALSGGALAALSADGASLCAARIAAGAGAMGCAPLRTLLGGGAAAANGGAAAALVAAGDGGRFFLSVEGSGVYLVSVNAEGPRLVASFPGATAAAAPVAPDARALVFGPAGDDGRVAVSAVDVSTGAASPSAPLPPPAAPHPVHGPPPAVRAAFPSPNAAAGALVVWSDHGLSLFRGGALAWTREEALASVAAVEFIDLPAARGAAAGAKGGAAAAALREGGGAAAAAGGAGAADGLRRWVRMQALAVMVQFKLGSDQDAAELVRLREELSDKNFMHRDPNGLRKLVVVATAAGKTLALHNGDGRVIWAARLGGAGAGAGGGAGAGAGRAAAPQPPRLLRWRRFHDLAHAPQIAWVAAGGGGGSGGACVLVLDGATGRELERIELPHPVAKIVPLPQPLHDGTAEQYAYAFVRPAPAAAAAPPRALAARLVPGGPEARAHFAEAAPSLVFWDVFASDAASDGAAGAGAGALAGYAFDAAAGDDDEIEARLAWSVALHGKLLAVAARAPGEPMRAAVKVLGDRSLKFKYTDPNIILVVTGQPSPGDASAPPRVTAALVSGADGAVLHQQAHEGATGPALAVVSEHWAVYAHHDTATARQQVTSLELFDATPRDLSLGTVLSTVFGGAGAEGATGAVGGGGGAPLSVLSQSFYTQVRAKLLSVTQTLSGINLKQLLIGTVTDQLYAMDHRYLDPRRPIGRAKPTPEEAEERLLPYSPLLPFAPLSYATQDKEVAALRGVASAPAGLESTSLVLAYGADLFYTRLAPGRHFDSLPEDFNYGLLVAGLAALAGGTAWARRYSREAMLRAAWK
ncbi:ER membrane complex subunit 1 [Raphidocelis subcapitata]|uniref:ER membrane protein complex subunit 1 n=1 Tax=Raphidocelis subcapitata TaxID=307507 RepID=A0A2V0PA13_9CHLO|nr:ER membrane complex subunit 1 [Raphidocelis subcapitata]|eukprot:GBF96686.1 ER membrane complex subunit 1 [Raphidocelis subcapitata]